MRSGCLLSQLPDQLYHYAEEIRIRDETAEIPVAAYEIHQDLSSRPLDLNSASLEQLTASGLFTPFQAYSVIRYRERYGPFFSVYELKGVNGFTLNRLKKLLPYLVAGPGMVVRKKSAPGFKMILTVQNSLPLSSGYSNGGTDQGSAAYPGSPVKTSLRIKSTAGRHLSMGMAYEKDAGELYSTRMLPEHLAGYLSYSGSGVVRQFLIGCFQLHHGMGLLNGTGFLHSPEGYLLNRNPLMLLKPYASVRENGYGQGFACRLDLSTGALLCWTSYNKLDLSLQNVQSTSGEKPYWIDLQRTTGLHRTSAEMKGRSLAYRIHSGIQYLVRFNSLSLGSTLSVEGCGLTRKGVDSLKWDPGPDYGGIMSLHGLWQGRRIEFFGEMSIRPWSSFSFLGGINFHFSDYLEALLLVHRYGNDHHGILPSSYASGSRIRNENGFALHLHTEPGAILTADFTAEIFFYPAPRFLAGVPSTGYRYSLSLLTAGEGAFEWRIRMTKKSWETTTGHPDTGLPPLNNHTVNKLDFKLLHNPYTSFSWQVRIISSWLPGGPDEKPGVAAAQQVRFALLEHLKCTFQFVVFRVDEWDGRIYIYEPGLYYSFNFPLFYGSGQKITSLVSLKAGTRITLSAETSFLTYYDRESIGSGKELIPGNSKWELGFQLRLDI